MKDSQALLMLDDGTCFEGTARGACQEAFGEFIFTTSMAGYQEFLTDPALAGQIVVFTSAHMGNYGMTAEDDEAASVMAAGAVFHDLFIPGSEVFPHWRAVESLDQRLKREGVTAISGVDTRSLAAHLREHGARNGIISALDPDRASLLRRARELPPMAGLDLVSRVTCREQYQPEMPGAKPNDGKELSVAVLDLGVKSSFLRRMQGLGMRVTVWPATTRAEDILATRPDGVFLSSGPGDPEPCHYAIACVKKLLGAAPIFGICLGGQILALALGAKTFKMKNGHRSSNHPVADIQSGNVWITSQNHGFCIDAQSLPGTMRPTRWNANDQTLAGFECTDLPAFAVQFHPETGLGAVDGTGVFEHFHTMMVDFRNKK
jgi:carbamoyl-phosphate synthase, small subunit